GAAVGTTDETVYAPPRPRARGLPPEARLALAVGGGALVLGIAIGVGLKACAPANAPPARHEPRRR
ncbi:MAG TPA: hypothetical protein VHB21_24905, partial [Minicystis sp.]|nr:hypothetical protein [Minicystis sp.]